jgi:hypothetical protein
MRLSDIEEKLSEILKYKLNCASYGDKFSLKPREIQMHSLTPDSMTLFCQLNHLSLPPGFRKMRNVKQLTKIILYEH